MGAWLHEYNEVLENGDSLGVVKDYTYYGCPDGRTGVQDVTILPFPKRPDEFMLIHKGRNSIGEPIDVPAVLYSHIIKDETFPNGKVFSKNNIIVEGDFLRSYLTSVQHANKEDWWIIQPATGSNTYFIFLLDSFGIELIHEQNIGEYYVLGASASGQAKFSPDGKKYATYNYLNELQVFDFDRSTGLLSNPLHETIDTSTEVVFSGLEWSSNSRFLYASSTFRLYQIDTKEDILSDGIQLIEEWSGLSDPFANVYFLMSLAPDCRIYMRSTGGAKSYHVIHYPNRKGMECGFVEAGLPLPKDNGFANFPNHPHWRIDEVEKCDSSILTIFGKPVYYSQDIQLFPNPTANTVQLNKPTIVSGGKISIYDYMGRLVYSQHWDTFQLDIIEVDVNILASGLYVVELIPTNNPNRIIYSGSFQKL